MVLDSPLLAFHQSPGRPKSSSIQDHILLECEVFDGQDSLDRQLVVPSAIISISPGSPIYLRNANGSLRRSGSLGWRAQANVPGQGSRVGFVTAAHLSTETGRRIQNGDRFFNSSNQAIGTVRLTRLDGIDTSFYRLGTRRYSY